MLALKGTANRPRSAIVSDWAFDPALLAQLKPPFAFVGDAGGSEDGEHYELQEARVAMTFFVEHHGDQYGEAVMLGAQRDTTSGTSVRRGILEVAPVLLAAVVGKGREAGVAMRVGGQSDSAPVQARVGTMGLLAKEFTVAMPICDTPAGEYPSPKKLAGALAGGTVTLTWTAPPARWDNPSRYAKVVRKASSAPTTSTDGTVLSTTASSGYTNAPGAGTWYYGVCSTYDEGSGTRLGTLRTAGPFTI